MALRLSQLSSLKMTLIELCLLFAKAALLLASTNAKQNGACIRKSAIDTSFDANELRQPVKDIGSFARLMTNSVQKAFTAGYGSKRI